MQDVFLCHPRRTDVGRFGGTLASARLSITAAHERHKQSKRYALCTMCVGVGQGIATLLERSDA